MQDDEYGGLFTSYADPSRNIAVGDTKAELSAVMRGRVEGRYLNNRERRNLKWRKT